MDMVIERGGLRDARASGHRNKAILLDVTYADPQAVGHMPAGRADRDGLAASKSKARKRSHYVRPDKCPSMRAQLKNRHPRGGTLFGSHGEGSDLIDQVY